MVVKARGADDASVVAIDGDERSTGIKGLLKELPEDIFLATVFGGMLLPDQRVGGDGIELAKVFRPQRPQLKQLALQNGLQLRTASGVSILHCEAKQSKFGSFLLLVLLEVERGVEQRSDLPDKRCKSDSAWARSSSIFPLVVPRQKDCVGKALQRIGDPVGELVRHLRHAACALTFFAATPAGAGAAG